MVIYSSDEIEKIIQKLRATYPKGSLSDRVKIAKENREFAMNFIIDVAFIESIARVLLVDEVSKSTKQPKAEVYKKYKNKTIEVLIPEMGIKDKLGDSILFVKAISNLRNFFVHESGTIRGSIKTQLSSELNKIKNVIEKIEAND